VLRPDAEPVSPVVTLPDMAPGRYRVTRWNTRAGTALGGGEVRHGGGRLALTVEGLVADMAVAVCLDRR
jgi:hypothetical protein